MLQDEFANAPYVVHQLLGNAGFDIKIKRFVSAYINEGKVRSECSSQLHEILEENGVDKAGIAEVLSLLIDMYRKEPLLNK